MQCVAFSPALAMALQERCMAEMQATQSRILARHTGVPNPVQPDRNATSGSRGTKDAPLQPQNARMYESISAARSLRLAGSQPHVTVLLGAVRAVMPPAMGVFPTAPRPAAVIAAAAAAAAAGQQAPSSPPLLSPERLLAEKERVWVLFACFLAAGRALAPPAVSVQTLLGAARANPVSLLWDVGGSAREAVWLDSVYRMRQDTGGGGAGGARNQDDPLLRGLVGRWQDAGVTAADSSRAYVPTQALYVPTFVDAEGRVYCCPREAGPDSSNKMIGGGGGVRFVVACWTEAGESNRRRARPRNAAITAHNPATRTKATHGSSLADADPNLILAVLRGPSGAPGWWGCKLPPPLTTAPQGVELTSNAYLWAPGTLLVTVSGITIPWPPRGIREETTLRFQCAGYSLTVVRRLQPLDGWV